MIQHWSLDHLEQKSYFVHTFSYVFAVPGLEIAAIFVLRRALFLAFADIYSFLNYSDICCSSILEEQEFDSVYSGLKIEILFTFLVFFYLGNIWNQMYGTQMNEIRFSESYFSKKE